MEAAKNQAHGNCGAGHRDPTRLGRCGSGANTRRCRRDRDGHPQEGGRYACVAELRRRQMRGRRGRACLSAIAGGERAAGAARQRDGVRSGLPGARIRRLLGGVVYSGGAIGRELRASCVAGAGRGDGARDRASAAGRAVARGDRDYGRASGLREVDAGLARRTRIHAGPGAADRSAMEEGRGALALHSGQPDDARRSL